MIRLLRDLLAEKRGSVAILSAFCFVILIAVATLTIQGSFLYARQLQGQRTADLATLAAAGTPLAIANSAPSTMAIATARHLATINGFGAASVVTTATTTGPTPALLTTIRDTETLFFSAVGSATSADVVVRATAAPPIVGTPACVASLGTSVSIAAGATLTGTACGVAAQTVLTVDGSLAAASVTVGADAAEEAAALGTPAALTPVRENFITGARTGDAIAATSAITAIQAHLSDMATWPYATTSPVVPKLVAVPTGTALGALVNTSRTIPSGSHHTTLAMTGSTLTISGGSPDPDCLSPTTFSGPATFDGTNTIALGAGCFVFGSDLVNSPTTAGDLAITSTAPGGDVTIVIVGKVSNLQKMKITICDSSLSIAGPITNLGKGAIALGAGRKVFGDTINSSPGLFTAGNGAVYMLKAGLTTAAGTIQFGDGPFYFFNGDDYGGIASTGYGTMSFGRGPFYFYRTSIINGVTPAVCPLLMFGRGPYLFYNGSFRNEQCGYARIGPGAMDFHGGGNFIQSGGKVRFGWDGSGYTGWDAGSSLVSLDGGSFRVSAGVEFLAPGVTVALTTGDVAIAAGSVSAGAPTASTPTNASRNLLFYTDTGSIRVGTAGAWSYTLSGLMYAPGGAVTLSGNGNTLGTSGGCLGAVAGSVTLGPSVTFRMVPCSGLLVYASPQTAARLK